jgi:hypothetical protein
MATLAVMGWILYSSARCQGRVGSYWYVSSWVVLKIDATQNLQRGDIYPYRGALGHAEARAPILGN